MVMIATLQGTIAEKIGDVVVIDVGGVGYGLLVTSEDFSSLETGQSTKLYIYEHVREQSYDLFGFSKLETKVLFEKLLGVNGVGPRMAINVLSIGSTASVRSAIAQGNVKFIQAAQGVGKKVAERIIVDLKDKVGLASNDLADIGLLMSEAEANKDEAVAALVVLGYSIPDASAMLASVDPKLPTEERLRLALKRN
jgi:Holliday junction DNA helicase RuvA